MSSLPPFCSRDPAFLMSDQMEKHWNQLGAASKEEALVRLTCGALSTLILDDYEWERNVLP